METTTTSTWAIDPSHSEIAFKVKHLMITNVKGVFKEFDATVNVQGDDFRTADIVFSLNPASVDTGAPDRDGHLKSADFFDVENHNILTFRGDSIAEKGDDGNYTLLGNMTIKGITKPIALDVEFGGLMKDPWGNEKAGYSITGKIHRKDWGLNWNATLETGGLLVSDDVKINCEIQLVKKS